MDTLFNGHVSVGGRISVAGFFVFLLFSILDSREK